MFSQTEITKKKWYSIIFERKQNKVPAIISKVSDSVLEELFII